MTESLITHWTKVSGNNLLQKVNAKMLLPEGYAIRCSIGNRRKNQMVAAYVLFDRAYVVAKLVKIFDELAINPDEALELTNEAMQSLEVSRNEKEEENV